MTLRLTHSDRETFINLSVFDYTDYLIVYLSLKRLRKINKNKNRKKSVLMFKWSWWVCLYLLATFWLRKVRKKNSIRRFSQTSCSEKFEPFSIYKIIQNEIRKTVEAKKEKRGQANEQQNRRTEEYSQSKGSSFGGPRKNYLIGPYNADPKSALLFGVWGADLIRAVLKGVYHVFETLYFSKIWYNSSLECSFSFN